MVISHILACSLNASEGLIRRTFPSDALCWFHWPFLDEDPDFSGLDVVSSHLWSPLIFSVIGLFHPNLSVSFISLKERTVAMFLECAVDLHIPRPHSFSQAGSMIIRRRHTKVIVAF